MLNQRLKKLERTHQLKDEINKWGNCVETVSWVGAKMVLY
jgi:hypothetical protein